ncbi:MAG: S-layer homology domain-containing protein [Clostridia bacterium]|nr:S-layer homology domain-containing protein [Clostridia bacterium]
MNKSVIARIFSLVLVCMLCVGSLGISTVSALDADYEEAYNAMEVLRLLEFIPDYYDYNVNMQSTVTRADFAVSVARIMNFGSYSGNGVYYYDVPKTHWAYDEICALTDNGVLSGNGNKLFRPDDVITAPEAYKMLLTAMGYGIYAEYNGGYPAGYFAAASKADIDVTANGELTVADMFLILFNGMKANIFDAESFSSTGAEYSVSEDKTLLTVYHDIYYEEGILTGADCITLDGAILEDDEVVIDGVTYIGRDIELGDYFGQYVEVFYHHTKNAQDKTILWAAPTGESQVLEFTAERDACFDAQSFTLEYYDAQTDKLKEITLDRGMTVIYNGGCTAEKVDEIFNLPEYTAKLVKNGSKYKVAVVKSYDNIVVERIDSENLIVYDKLVPTKSVKLDPDLYEKMTLKMLGSSGAEFGSIAVGNVLSVYKSKDGRYLEADISGNQLSGIIDSVETEEGGFNVVVNAIEYYLPEEAAPKGISAGISVIMYMDAQGKPAYVKESASKYSPAYLIDVAKESSGLDNCVNIRLMGSDGIVTVAPCADKVKIDGDSKDNITDIYSALCPDIAFAPQFAMVMLNSEGCITVIDTVKAGKGGTNDVLAVNSPYKLNQEFRTFGAFGMTSFVNSNTLFFSVPADDKAAAADDDEFITLRMNQLVDGTKMNIETYKTEDRIGYDQFVVIKGYGTSNFVATQNPIVVEKIVMKLDSEGEQRECVKGYQGTGYVEYMAGDSYSFMKAGISDGDTIRVRINARNEIEGAQILVDYSDIENSITGAPETSTSYTTSLGYAYDVVGDVVKISYNKDNLTDVGLVMSTASRAIIVYDSEALPEKVRTGTVDDIITYYNNGSDCSKVFLVQGYMIPKVFVIYK